MTDSGSPPARGRRSRPAERKRPSRGEGNDAAAVAADLSFNEARTALDLTLEALQAADLPIEEMAGLYQRANAFAERCQSLLEAVEQEVIQWEDSPQADG